MTDVLLGMAPDWVRVVVIDLFVVVVIILVILLVEVQQNARNLLASARAARSA
jgi:hypothetical protein